MNLLIFAVRDNKASVYNRPFVEHNVISAVRAFTVGVNSPETQLHQFPTDFELTQIGEFDDITGKITPTEPPKFILSAMSVLKSKEADEVPTKSEKAS